MTYTNQQLYLTKLSWTYVSLVLYIICVYFVYNLRKKSWYLFSGGKLFFLYVEQFSFLNSTTLMHPIFLFFIWWKYHIKDRPKIWAWISKVNTRLIFFQLFRWTLYLIPCQDLFLFIDSPDYAPGALLCGDWSSHWFLSFFLCLMPKF